MSVLHDNYDFVLKIRETCNSNLYVYFIHNSEKTEIFPTTKLNWIFLEKLLIINIKQRHSLGYDVNHTNYSYFWYSYDLRDSIATGIKLI